MRLLEFSDLDNVLELVANSKYWQINKGGTRPLLYHRTHSSIPEKYTVLDIKERKAPRDTAPFIHNMVNLRTKQSMGVEVRNLFFVTAYKLSTSNIYGPLYVAVPLGDYSLIYSGNTVFDFTEEHNFSVNRENFDVTIDMAMTDRALSEYATLTSEQVPANIKEIVSLAFARAVGSKPSTFNDLVTSVKKEFAKYPEADENLKKSVMVSVMSVKEDVDRYTKSLKETKVSTETVGEVMLKADKVILIETKYFDKMIRPELEK